MLEGELPRIPIPRTPVNKGMKRKGRGMHAPRPYGSFSRILLRALPLPLSGLECLAQLRVRLRRDDQVLILVEDQLAYVVVRDGAVGREYEDPRQVHHNPRPGTPEPEVHAVFDLGNGVEVARDGETVNPVPFLRVCSPTACLRRPETSGRKRAA